MLSLKFRSAALTKKVLEINPEFLASVPDHLKTVENCRVALKSKNLQDINAVIKKIPSKMFLQNVLISDA